MQLRHAENPAMPVTLVLLPPAISRIGQRLTVNRPAILSRPLPQPLGQQNLALFRIYVAYRSLLSVVLLIMLVSPNTRQLVGALNPALYLGVALGYLATSVPLVGS